MTEREWAGKNRVGSGAGGGGEGEDWRAWSPEASMAEKKVR